MLARGFVPEEIHKTKQSHSIGWLVFVLCFVGLVFLFSASYYRSELLFGNPYYFFKQQFIRMIIGAVFAFIISKVNFESLTRFLPLLILLNILLLILTFIPGIGVSFWGANRWIIIAGISFQPSEFAKFTLVFYLAYILSKKKDAFDEPFTSIIPPAIVIFIFSFLVYLQNDFSTAIFLLFIGAFMLFIAGVPIRYFLYFIVVALPLLLILLFTKEHRVLRLITFLDPSRDPDGTGYQIQVSMRAMSEGGLWGKGIGAGDFKFGILPEAHSDFVFSIFAEEMGFVGVLVVFALFSIFAVRAFSVSINQESFFYRMLGFGSIFTIVLQVLLNISVVSGLLPTTGIPLPFFSAGGSSALITLALCGLIINISKSSEGGWNV
ncbi:putative lipid II flippase FtsW [Spirochaetia bacterium 38H-sp]|uniref:Probable peptidoglycan glycosyltransferase FtsW n=1 Tax=Rarispira pelagica TaxID=3141764 RepID=A0ABU9UDC6_9SPIR